MYNEKDNIEEMIFRTLAVAPELADDFEIVVVDDASTDGCGEIVERIARTHPQVRCIRHPVNRKLGGALKTGFAAATKDIAIYTDSDLPIDMNDIKLALPYLGEADLLIGYRLVRTEGLRRRVISKAYNWIIRRLFGLRVRDVNFAFKVLRRRLLEVIELRSEGSFIDAEIILEALRHGFRVREVGMMFYQRTAGKSSLAGTGVILKILAEMWEYRGRTRGSRRDAGSVVSAA
ncbi:MAG: glycosyltransferase family 2 protein [Candidatus Eisenbacteria bacterium]|nr:glycosyltransferase family 2 protein [Candidatus Eisenbacteria bacterium]